MKGRPNWLLHFSLFFLLSSLSPLSISGMSFCEICPLDVKGLSFLMIGGDWASGLRSLDS